MAGRALGDAFVGISPDLTGFGASLAGKIKAALKGVPASVLVTADTKAALGDIAAMRAQAAALLAKSVDLRATVNTKPALASLVGLQATFAAIGKSLDRSSLGDAALLRLQARLLAAEGSLDAMAAAAARDAAPIGLLSGAAGIAGGLFGVLGTRVQLFGGALTAAGVPAILATAGGLHILIDGLIETAAVVIPASIALGAFGVAAIPTIQTISAKMQAIYTTSTALGQSIYPLTGQFSALAAAVQPQVYTLFGEGLVVVAHNTGLLTTIAQQAGNALDTLGARAAAALTSGGLGTFLKQGPADLAQIGDIIGNIFGTIGNLLRAMPGYANALLSALDDVTKGLEAVTGSPIGQWLASLSLAFHGAILWGGLAATAVLLLGNALTGLAAKFGLAAAGAEVFDVAQFIGGIQTLIGGVGLLGKSLITMAGAEDIAASSSLALDGAMAALGAVSPVGWVLLAAAAIAGLVLWLGKARTATDAWGQAQQAAISNSSGISGIADVINFQARAQQRLTAATSAYNKAAAPYAAMIAAGGRAGQAAGEALSGYAAAVNSARADVAQAGGDVSNLSQIMKAAGGNTSFLTGTSISFGDAITKGGSALKEYLIEVQANADAQQALGLGIGRSAAAQNAQTNEWLTSTVPAMQKVITAEDSLLSIITGGQAAFNDFQQSIQGVTAKFVSPSGLADAAKLAGGNLTGLNQQSLAFSNTLYSQSIPALQKTIDALELQGISTGDLTKATATGAGQILAYTGNNKEARSVIVDLINNALGPGTVSLVTLNKWVAQNSTTLSGFNGIVATATANAGTLAGTLKTQLTAQFVADLLAASGASGALKIYTQDLVNNTQGTAQGKGDRAQLIADLEKGGLTAQQAGAYVDSLQKSIDALHGKDFTVQMDGHGQFTITGPGVLQSQGAGGSGNAAGGLAAGGYIGTGTGPRADDVPIMASKGEYVVQAASVARYGKGMMNAINSGRFAGGGPVSGNLTPGFITGMAATFQQDMTNSMVTAMRAAIKAAEAAAAATSNAGAGPGGGVQRWAGVVHNVLGQLGLPYADSGTILSQMNTESGGNPTIVNKTDSNWLAGHPSVGLMQVIAGTFAAYANQYRNTGPFEYGVSTNPTANVFAGVNYAIHTYGNPGFLNVLGHGHGYALGGLVMDKGGYLAPGWNPPIYNGTGRPEPVGAAGDTAGTDKLLAELRALRAEVRNLNATVGAVPRATGEHVGAAVNGAAAGAAWRHRYPLGGA